ncbi:phosphatidylinositol 3,4,5-trisphosphate 3-phosphatase and dual-specificity protein phosphatase PTEN isoform X3 [Rhipicephalus microplus]|uniref:phosphatidylinositol 3,4,5-trisphosphate 3-phosphatase and dual-specificity protein phosphatase PTEN isoform X3 n=1 Tax=Rhipicephalus microplus TaxID=6941 RepID=UPI003F6C3C72
MSFKNQCEEEFGCRWLSPCWSRMTMTARIKQVVSKNKKRYQDEDFDLDLSYISDNIIAMGFPAEKLEGVFRNHMDDVQKFLEKKHKGHYKIYNLCSERQYDAKKFENRVAHYPFKDHNPPKIDLIKPFCEDVAEWLSKHPSNVAVIHCKAGKGRTGVMVCSYLVHSRMFATAGEALSYYSERRTKDLKGVTIPSQRRYVEYYAKLVSTHAEYNPETLVLHSLSLEPVPTFNGGTCSPFFLVWKSDASTMEKLYVSPMLEGRKGNSTSLCFHLTRTVALKGDIKVEVYNKPKMMKKEKMFQFWFNTFFVPPSCNSSTGGSNVGRGDTHSHPNGVAGGGAAVPVELRVHNGGEEEMRMLVLCKDDLDKAYKDKTHSKFSKDFKVSLKFVSPSHLCPPGAGGDDPNSDIDGGPGSDSDTTDDDDWDTQEATHI